MNLHHFVLSTRERLPLHLEPAPRRSAVLAVARVGGQRVPAFAFADDHLHALVDDEGPAFLGGRIALALKALPGAEPFQPGWTEPVTDRPHLRRLITYILRQPEHHGLGDPADWEGSCFADLVGARVLDGFDPDAWRANLPREHLDLVWEAVRLDPPSGVSVQGQPLNALIEAASKALAADPRLLGHHARVVRARRVAVALAVEAGFVPEQIALALGITDRAVRRLAAAPCPPIDLRAAKRSLAISVALLRRRLKAA